MPTQPGSPTKLTVPLRELVLPAVRADYRLVDDYSGAAGLRLTARCTATPVTMIPK